MADMTPIPDPIVPPGDAVLEAGGPRSFLASPSAKIVVIVAAVVGLLVIVGVVVGLVLLNVGKKTIEQATVDSVNASLNATGTPASAAVEATSQGNKLSVPVTNKDVFVSRDPFEPILRPLPPVVESSETTIPASERNVLTLQEIVSMNGTLKALLKWDGAQYQAGVNEQLGSSPWKVLSITKTTVTMLYGDVQVTLTVGEGVQRD